MSVLGLPAEAASISTLGRPDAIRCWPGDGRIPTHFRRNLSVIPPAGGKSRCISHVFHPGEKKRRRGSTLGPNMTKPCSKCQILQHLQHHPASSSTSAYLGHPDRLEIVSRPCRHCPSRWMEAGLFPNSPPMRQTRARSLPRSSLRRR